MSVTILQGDARAVLPTLAAESVHCIVTSPPYWRQRDYAVPGQIGLETTPAEYIAHLTEIFMQCHRVLRGDGSCWVNIGDRWLVGGHGGGGTFGAVRGDSWVGGLVDQSPRRPPPGLKDKDLVGLPWMFAFAMRAEGWYLRQCNIWAKPNAMPESVGDRSTMSHEYVFQFSKSERYWYDTDAARTPLTPDGETRLQRRLEKQRDAPRPAQRHDKQRGHSRRHAGFNTRWDQMHRADQMRNGGQLRSVWWLATAQNREANYAVMPDALAEICIVCGCPVGGTVLDPFAGAGTSGLVADRLQRAAILIELNPDYAALARERISRDAPLLTSVV